VSFVLKVPAASAAASSTRRVPQYVSPKTGSVRIVLQSVNGAATALAYAAVAKIANGAPGCAADQQNNVSCTIGASAPAGLDVFAVSTYQSPDASGPVLASTTVSANVSQTATSSITLSLGGVPARVTFSPTQLPLVADGTIQRVAVTLNVADASGATIVGASPYQSPVSLAIMNDPAHALSLSTTSVSQPGSVVTVTYDSSKQLAQGQIVASDNAMAAATLNAAPLTVTPSPVVLFADALSTGVTVTEAGFTGSFSASLANSNDATASVVPGTLNSGGAVVTLAPKVRFDATTLNVSDGNVTAPIPVTIVPHNSAYSAFGNAHQISTGTNMVEAPDGSLWVGDLASGSLDRFDPSTGTYASYVVSSPFAGPNGIAADANGNIWFANGSNIGEYTPSTSSTVTYSTGLQPSATVTAIVAGAPGTMWFYDYGTNNAVSGGRPTFFGSIDTSTGQIQEYPTSNAAEPRSTDPMSMLVASDHSLWFADEWNYAIGHLDPASGTIAEFKITTPANPQESPQQLAITADGKIWAACFGSGGTAVIASLDPQNGNAITTHAHGLEGYTQFFAFAKASDGNLWFVENNSSFGISADLALGVFNPTTGAIYHYPTPLFPQNARVASLIDRGDGTLWMFDPAFGQIGKVTFK
jgi:streptogramin lyase